MTHEPAAGRPACLPFHPRVPLPPTPRTLSQARRATARVAKPKRPRPSEAPNARTPGRIKVTVVTDAPSTSEPRPPRPAPYPASAATADGRGTPKRGADDADDAPSSARCGSPADDAPSSARRGSPADDAPSSDRRGSPAELDRAGPGVRSGDLEPLRLDATMAAVRGGGSGAGDAAAATMADEHQSAQGRRCTGAFWSTGHRHALLPPEHDRTTDETERAQA